MFAYFRSARYWAGQFAIALADRDQLKAQVSDLNGNYTTARARLVYFQKLAKESGTQASNARGYMRQQVAVIRSQQGRLNAQAESIRWYQARERELDADAQEALQGIKTVNGDNSKLGAQLAEARKQVSALTEEIDMLRRQFRDQHTARKVDEARHNFTARSYDAETEVAKAIIRAAAEQREYQAQQAINARAQEQQRKYEAEQAA